MPKLDYRPDVYKQLAKIPRVEQKKIIRKLEILTLEPYSGKPLRGDYNGFYSLKAWPYRIIYIIEKKGILVFSIKHRQNSYKR